MRPGRGSSSGKERNGKEKKASWVMSVVTIGDVCCAHALIVSLRIPIAYSNGPHGRERSRSEFFLSAVVRRREGRYSPPPPLPTHPTPVLLSPTYLNSNSNFPIFQFLCVRAAIPHISKLQFQFQFQFQLDLDLDLRHRRRRGRRRARGSSSSSSSSVTSIVTT